MVLRQGDPVSPYLFTLVMEVLNLMVKRQTRRHKRFRRGLDEFIMSFGLYPSMNKSNVFFCNIPTDVKEEIKLVMPFREGLGLEPQSSMHEWNTALMDKHLWNIIISKDSIWVKWVKIHKLKGKNLWEIELNRGMSWCWKHLLNLRDKIKEFVYVLSLNGKSYSLWFDKWHPRGPLSKLIDVRMIGLAGLSTNAKERLKPMALLEDLGNEWAMVISGVTNKPAKNIIWSVIQRLTFGAAIYFLWQERNNRRVELRERFCDPDGRVRIGVEIKRCLSSSKELLLSLSGSKQASHPSCSLVKSLERPALPLTTDDNHSIHNLMLPVLRLDKQKQMPIPWPLLRSNSMSYSTSRIEDIPGSSSGNTSGISEIIADHE
ncbi:hypothetical protein Tco_1004536 [Tanacetum coccineum]|uniref:Reverse transcriptase zinc-binding domain-containing protein n=1 Tax=Tanacetum coccineum TaxID=301880 RepID=A0ABQ5FCW2_9ASTR